MSQVTRTPLSMSKGQRSRSPGLFTQRGLNAQGGCSGQRGNVFDVGKYYYVASVRRRARRLGAHGGEGRDILCRHAHSLLRCNFNIFKHGFTLLRSQILHKVNLHRGSGQDPAGGAYSTTPTLPPPAGREEPHFHCRLFTLGVAVLRVAALPLNVNPGPTYETYHYHF